jgi:hypothetical protein
MLPGYPASHGCVRLPLKFSELLFGITHVGTPVILAGSHADPREVVHPGLVLSEYAAHEYETVVAKNLKGKSNPWAATVQDFSKPVAVLVSSADRTVTLLEEGQIIAQGGATIRDSSTPLGSHVLILIDAHDGHRGMVWQGTGHSHGSGNAASASEVSVIQRIKADRPVIEALTERMHPGMVLITTDLPAHPDTRSNRDFVVMSTETS